MHYYFSGRTRWQGFSKWILCKRNDHEMNYQLYQTGLLKEYIKTMVASRPIFPGILPRKWEKGFSDAELHEIYQSLKSVIKLANPYTQESLIREFESFDYSPQYLRWYLDRFWREVVDLMTAEPTLADRYPASFPL